MAIGPRLAALLVAPLCLAAGCAADPTDPTGGDQVQNPNPSGTGRFFIAWTIADQVPNASLCGGIARLSLDVTYPDVRYTINPIPCILDRFRYDGMPTGSATLTLTGYDANSCALTSGTAPVVITPTKPESPSPTLALATPRACP